MDAQRVGGKVATLCAIGCVVGAVLAIGFEYDYPTWAYGVFFWVLITNAITVVLLWRQQWQWDSGVGTAVMTVGISNIVAWKILRVFSNLGLGSNFTPGFLLFYIFIPGIIMGSIGLWFLNSHEIRESIRTNTQAAVGIGVGAILLEVVFGSLTGVFSLVVFLWAHGLGFYVLPIVALGAIRWGQQAEGLQIATVGVISAGVILVLITPMWTYSHVGTLAGCFGADWPSSLRHSIDWTTMRVSWYDGCNSRSFAVERRPAVVGAVITGLGVIGERLLAIRGL